jgi:hypothetical protein
VYSLSSIFTRAKAGSADEFVGHEFHFVLDFVAASAHEALDRVDRSSWDWSRPDAWQAAPTKRSPVLENATTEGVVRAPSAVRDHHRFAALDDGDAGVGGSEVNSDDFRHGRSPSMDCCFVRFDFGQP